MHDTGTSYIARLEAPGEEARSKPGTCRSPVHRSTTIDWGHEGIGGPAVCAANGRSPSHSSPFDRYWV